MIIVHEIFASIGIFLYVIYDAIIYEPIITLIIIIVSQKILLSCSTSFDHSFSNTKTLYTAIYIFESHRANDNKK